MSNNYCHTFNFQQIYVKVNNIPLKNIEKLVCTIKLLNICIVNSIFISNLILYYIGGVFNHLEYEGGVKTMTLQINYPFKLLCIIIINYTKL